MPVIAESKVAIIQCESKKKALTREVAASKIIRG